MATNIRIPRGYHLVYMCVFARFILPIAMACGQKTMTYFSRHHAKWFLPHLKHASLVRLIETNHVGPYLSVCLGIHCLTCTSDEDLPINSQNRKKLE